jgi:hypothetical protein
MNFLITAMIAVMMKMAHAFLAKMMRVTQMTAPTLILMEVLKEFLKEILKKTLKMMTEEILKETLKMMTEEILKETHKPRLKPAPNDHHP